MGDKKPTWTAAFHEKTPGAYVCNIGSGQTEGYASKYFLEDASKFNYYEETNEYKAAAKKDQKAVKTECKDFSASAYRKPENLKAVAEKIVATLVAVHKANQTTPIIARGTGKHRQKKGPIDGPANFEKLIETILAEAKKILGADYPTFRNIFSGELLPGDDEARFGGASICDILGPLVQRVQDVTTILSIESGKGSTQYAFWKSPKPLSGTFWRKGLRRYNERSYTIYADGKLTYTDNPNASGWLAEKFAQTGSLDLGFGKTKSIEKVP